MKVFDELGVKPFERRKMTEQNQNSGDHPSDDYEAWEWSNLVTYSVPAHRSLSRKLCEFDDGSVYYVSLHFFIEDRIRNKKMGGRLSVQRFTSGLEAFLDEKYQEKDCLGFTPLMDKAYDIMMEKGFEVKLRGDDTTWCGVKYQVGLYHKPLRR